MCHIRGRKPLIYWLRSSGGSIMDRSILNHGLPNFMRATGFIRSVGYDTRKVQYSSVDFDRADDT